MSLLRRGGWLDANAAASLARVLVDPTFELIPFKNVRDPARGATVSVTASPGKGIEATVDLAIELDRPARARHSR